MMVDEGPRSVFAEASDFRIANVTPSMLPRVHQCLPHYDSPYLCSPRHLFCPSPRYQTVTVSIYSCSNAMSAVSSTHLCGTRATPSSTMRVYIG